MGRCAHARQNGAEPFNSPSRNSSQCRHGFSGRATTAFPHRLHPPSAEDLTAIAEALGYAATRTIPASPAPRSGWPPEAR